MWCSCMRSEVHHLFVYGDGLALGVREWTTSKTVVINVSVFCCTVPSDGGLRDLVILVLISFHGAFLSRSLSWCFGMGTKTSKTVLIIWWSDPCSVPYSVHLTVASFNSSEARTRSIVVS